MCTDYRKVNTQTVSDSFLPIIDDIIDSVRNATLLTKIDQLRGNYQVPLTENAKNISALVTPCGLYHYKVMPSGFRSVPFTFQSLITDVTDELENVYSYLDVTHLDGQQSHMLTRVFFREA